MCKGMKALIMRKFDGIGAEVNYDTVVKRYNDAARIELFKTDKVIKLNIRFDEVFHRCEGEEWESYLSFLQNQRVPIQVNKWWQFWDR